MIELGKVGVCLNCRRLLISDVYSLCWNCASMALSGQAPVGKLAAKVPEQPEELLYRDIGGES